MTEEKKIPEVIIDRKKLKNRAHLTPTEQLEAYSKDELIARVQQLEAHTFQLKNIIKKGGGKCDHGEPRSDEQKHSQPRSSKNRPFDFTKCSKRRILLRVLYLGWDLDGYAVQDHSVNTIEHHLFAALTKSCLIEDRQLSNYHRCGRTDKGVSAFSQVISIDVRSQLSETEQVNLDKELPYCKMLNRLMPDEMKAVCWTPAPSQVFSARFDCIRRSYRYFFPRGNLNIVAMDQACKLLLGGHDFRNFCKMDVGNGVVDYKRSIFNAEVKVYSQESSTEGSYDLCEATITGKAFLWHQIRCIMSVLLLIGEGKEDASVISQLLDPNQPKPQYPLASDLPLVLFECDYENDLEWYFDREELDRVISKMQALWTANSLKTTIVRKMLTQLELKLDTPMCTQTDSLVMGVKPKIYQPLLKRSVCSSLESKIDHYVKRRKLKIKDADEEDSGLKSS